MSEEERYLLFVKLIVFYLRGGKGFLTNKQKTTQKIICIKFFFVDLDLFKYFCKYH
jgi:hypothetical protein